MYLFTKLKKKGRNIFNHIQWKHVLGGFNWMPYFCSVEAMERRRKQKNIMGIFTPEWLPVMMSNGTEKINVDYKGNKFVITKENGREINCTFGDLARYIVGNNMHWCDLGLDKFSKQAIHVRHVVQEWLDGQESGMVYSVQLDRVIIKKNGKLYVEGECIGGLPGGQFVVHPRAGLTETVSDLCADEKKSGGFPWLKVAVACLFGFIGGVAVTDAIKS